MKHTSGRRISRSSHLGSGTKVRKSYRLNPEKLAAAQKILGTATATEAIESALDMVVFRQELLNGTREMLGIRIESGEDGN
jgi:hypothetical protein